MKSGTTRSTVVSRLSLSDGLVRVDVPRARCWDDSYWWKRAESRASSERQQVEGNRGRAPYSNTALQCARPIRVRGRRRSVSSEQSERKEILLWEVISKCRVPAALRPCLSVFSNGPHTLSNRTDALLLYHCAIVTILTKRSFFEILEFRIFNTGGDCN